VTSWHSLTAKEVFKKLQTSSEGISDEEAKRRLIKFGRNKLPAKKHFNATALFLRQFKSPLIYLLVLASAVSFFLDEIVDGYIILAAVALAVIFGYLQEQKAENTLDKLEGMVKQIANVLRSGQKKEIDAYKLVPGDLLFIAAGDKIPADVRLVSCVNLEIQEAPLTGESYPVEKSSAPIYAGAQISEQICMAFMGTVVSRGRGAGIVVQTGANTEFGKIAQSLSLIKEEPTPFQKKISRLSRVISLVVSAVVFAIFIAGILRGIEPSELVTASVAVAVAAIPESLVVALTIILTIGMTRLLKKNVLVRKLVSAETLGSTTVICSDKTGTLTEGKMRVVEVFTDDESEKETIRDFELKSFALEISVIANEAYIENPREDTLKWKLHGDPTETALFEAAIDAGLGARIVSRERQVLDEIPFESDQQYMATMVYEPNLKSKIRNAKQKTIYYKGAPEKILSACSYIADLGSPDAKKHLYENHTAKLQKKYEDLSKKGLRVLCVAYRNLPDSIALNGHNIQFEKFNQIEDTLKDLVFVGFIALKDPLRESAKDTIRMARNAGIKVVMITGDNIFTARSIAGELGLAVSSSNLIEGKDLRKLSDGDFRKIISKITVYARIMPQDKLRIIDAFQSKGEVVAMTGDGVNDAPALKKADIGVAMGAGTDVAKEVSDIIIMDNNFRTIVQAVEQGRVIFDNLRKVTTYLLADSFTEIILLGGSIIAGFPLPIVAAQILWVNLVEDGLPTFALSYEPKEKDVMNLPPRGRFTPVLDNEMKVIIFIVGIVTDLFLLGVFLWLYNTTNDIAYARTMTFVALGLNSLVYIFSIKSLRHTIFSINVLNNKYLIGSVIFGFLMLMIAIYVPFFQDILQTVPLTIKDLGIVALISSLSLVGIEISKAIFITNRNK